MAFSLSKNNPRTIFIELAVLWSVLKKYNLMMQELIQGSNKFLIGRLGSVESQILCRWLEDSVPSTRRPLKSDLLLRKEGWINAGIWPPNNTQFEKFAKAYETSLLHATRMAVWKNPSAIPNEQQLMYRYCRETIQFPIDILDISALCDEFNDAWTHSLAEKRVLVISSFGNLIYTQYQKIAFLHTKNLVPEFELSVLTPPRTNGLKISLSTWEKEFELLKFQIQKNIDDFSPDIALVSAGAYGMPACDFLYQNDVSSIYVGGALQLYFGIWGTRWRTNSRVKNLSTEYWVDPPKKMKPNGSFLIEKSAYW